MAQSTRVNPSLLQLRQSFRSCTTYLLSLTFVMLVLGAIAAEPAYGSEDADDQEAAMHRVDSLHAELINIMNKGPDPALKSRYERLLPIVKEHFDVPLMARIALDQHWADMRKEERQKLVDRLRQLIAVTYAARLSEFEDQGFRTLDSTSTASNRIEVDSQLTTADAGTISLYYRLFLRDGRWRIYDVVKEGVGVLEMMQAQSSKVVAESGFSGFIKMVDERITEHFSEEARGNQ